MICVESTAGAKTQSETPPERDWRPNETTKSVGDGAGASALALNACHDHPTATRSYATATIVPLSPRVVDATVASSLPADAEVRDQAGSPLGRRRHILRT
jgi:hypothetical protein